MNRWAPINILLLQFLKPGTLHSKVDAALVLTVDRMNGVVKSAREYARQWGWSVDKVIRFMEDEKSYINLSRDSDATPETSIDGALQPVTRQQRYKTLAKVSATEARQQHDSNATPETCIDGDSQVVTRQQHDNDTTTTRRLFNRDKEKKNTCVHFDQFYAAYPRHENKPAAERAFNKLNPSAQLFNQMMDALDWQTKQQKWLKNNGQFIPLPVSWLKNRRWEDERPGSQAATIRPPQSPKQRLQVAL